MLAAIVLALVLLVLLAGSALFSAIETSFFSLQPFHIERLSHSRAAFAARSRGSWKTRAGSSPPSSWAMR